LLLVTCLVTIAMSTACHEPGHDRAEPQLESHPREYNFTLAPDGFVPVFGSRPDGTFTIRLPHLGIFDHEGQLLLDLKSYRTDLPKVLKEVTNDPKPLKGGRTLTEELSQMWAMGRRAPVMSDLSDADFFFVTNEAEWCIPCKDQLKDLRDFTKANPGIRINVVRVETDTKVFEADK